jgi:hypothetical protein
MYTSPLKIVLVYIYISIILISSSLICNKIIFFLILIKDYIKDYFLTKKNLVKINIKIINVMCNNLKKYNKNLDKLVIWPQYI